MFLSAVSLNVTSSSSNNILPSEGVIIPEIIFNSVDFPHPEGPTIQTISLRTILK